MPASSSRLCATALCILSSASLRTSSLVSATIASRLARSACVHECPDFFAGEYPPDVSRRLQVEHHNRELIVHAEGDGGGVHHFQPTAEHLEVGDRLEHLGIGLHHRVGVIHPVHPCSL